MPLELFVRFDTSAVAIIIYGRMADWKAAFHGYAQPWRTCCDKSADDSRGSPNVLGSFSPPTKGANKSMLEIVDWLTEETPHLMKRTFAFNQLIAELLEATQTRLLQELDFG